MQHHLSPIRAFDADVLPANLRGEGAYVASMKISRNTYVPTGIALSSPALRPIRRLSSGFKDQVACDGMCVKPRNHMYLGVVLADQKFRCAVPLRAPVSGLDWMANSLDVVLLDPYL